MNDQAKNRTRLIIRRTMVVIAVLLILVAVVIPIINNAIALRIENTLKKIPLPESTALIDSISSPGRFPAFGEGITYGGAILIKSDLSRDELESHYRPYLGQNTKVGGVVVQTDRAVMPAGDRLSFSVTPDGDGYYAVFFFDTSTQFAQFLLDLDMR